MQKLKSITNHNQIFIKFSPGIEYITITDGLMHYTANIKPKSLKKLLNESKIFEDICLDSKQIVSEIFNDLDFQIISYHNQLYICLILNDLELRKSNFIFMDHSDYGHLYYNFKSQSFNSCAYVIPKSNEFVLFY